jgi:hypothetical protein
MRQAIGALCLLFIVTAATPSEAIRRQRSSHPFFARTAVSGFFGPGVAVGEFSSSKDGDGRQDSPAFVWSAEIEHYFAPGLSIGGDLSHSSWDDKLYGDALKTNLRMFGVFVRYVVETPGPVYPFFRFGAGSMEVEFENETERVEADHAGSINVGGGAMARLGDYLTLNASARYTFGFTDDALLEEAVIIDGEETAQRVGFDVQYWTFNAGVSVYFP